MSTGRATWLTWDEVADVFGGPPDPEWASDQEGIDQSVEDPWEPTPGRRAPDVR